jgi:hypothetical protein
VCDLVSREDREMKREKVLAAVKEGGGGVVDVGMVNFLCA